MKVNLSQYSQPDYSRGRSKAVVMLWWLVQGSLFKFSLHNMYGFRRRLLRIFGARIGPGVKIRASAHFTYPWKVSIGENSWVGDRAQLYSLDEIVIESNSVVSQDAYLCTGTHDIEDPGFSLITSPITVKEGAWVAAGVFVYPGVTIHRNAVAAARSTVLKSIPPNEVHAGMPAKFVKERFDEKRTLRQKETLG